MAKKGKMYKQAYSKNCYYLPFGVHSWYDQVVEVPNAAKPLDNTIGTFTTWYDIIIMGNFQLSIYNF